MSEQGFVIGDDKIKGNFLYVPATQVCHYKGVDVDGEAAGVGVVVDVHEDAVVNVSVKDGGNEIGGKKGAIKAGIGDCVVETAVGDGDVGMRERGCDSSI
jgi:hypothetical protein